MFDVSRFGFVKYNLNLLCGSLNFNVFTAVSCMLKSFAFYQFLFHSLLDYHFYSSLFSFFAFFQFTFTLFGLYFKALTALIQQMKGNEFFQMQLQKVCL